MSEADTPFRVILRGYDPHQVHRRVDELVASVNQLMFERDDLTEELEAVRRERASEVPPAPASLEPPSYEHFGARVGQILALAEEEATELRTRVDLEVSSQRKEFEEEVARVREATDRYVKDTRSRADTQAARIVEDARPAADDRMDHAERDAQARIQEADALFEEQRAKAMQAVADFETTLAARRKAAEEEFTVQMAEVERRLGEAERTLEDAQAAAEATRDGANAEAESVVRAAEAKAQSILEDTRKKASRVRAESDRELVAATQRRDAINAQLGNVRQMLSTLTGSAAGLDPFDSGSPVEEPAVETEVEDVVEAVAS